MNSFRPGRLKRSIGLIKKMTKTGITGIIIGGLVILSAWVSPAGVLAPLDLQQVKVGGEIGRRIDVTVNNNLLVLDVDKDFLLPFQKKNNHSGYVGLGKTIEAAVRFAAYTKNDKVFALKKHLVEETIKTQESDGYIGIMAKDARMWRMWDIHEMGYILLGLTSDYRYFREKRSLDAACKLADYIIQRWSTMPSDWSRQTHYCTDSAVMGLDRAMVALYRETGEQRFLTFCVKERSLLTWNLGIVIGRRELMEGDASAYFSKCVSQLELNHLQPQSKLLLQSQRLVRFMTAADGMCITGAIGQWEVFTDDQDVRGGLGETCATVYQLRVFDNMLQIEGKPVYGDLLERTIYNTLFAAQSSDGRKLRYYTPLEGNREYFQNDTYCCPCNYRRAISELPAMIYYQSRNGLAVNLYTPSEASIELGGNVSVKIRQETDYPTSGRVTVRLDPAKPVKFPLQLRIPKWCDKAAATVNGQPVREQIIPGTFLSIKREWKAGDQVILDMPMTWRLVLGRKRQSGRAAVMRGPVVFCLNPAQDESLRNRDGADLGCIVLDSTSLTDSPGGDAFRPRSMVCQVKAGRGGTGVAFCSGLSLRLTEFVDPDGKCVYFRLPDLSVAVPDELLTGNGK
ncbi:MAG: glycoside hydrolase family 127 protein [Kiritimatiellae bacterium]|nr:glycoside hydrolase family 127 protein [Kiritimatiellia bacterium]MDD5522024.1 glycoside hydrolase family 127 protein [Kiritimatiellia bacterium]